MCMYLYVLAWTYWIKQVMHGCPRLSMHCIPYLNANALHRPWWVWLVITPFERGGGGDLLCTSKNFLFCAFVFVFVFLHLFRILAVFLRRCFYLRTDAFPFLGFSFCDFVSKWYRKSLKDGQQSYFSVIKIRTSIQHMKSQFQELRFRIED